METPVQSLVSQNQTRNCSTDIVQTEACVLLKALGINRSLPLTLKGGESGLAHHGPGLPGWGIQLPSRTHKGYRWPCQGARSEVYPVCTAASRKSFQMLAANLFLINQLCGLEGKEASSCPGTEYPLLLCPTGPLPRDPAPADCG